MKGSLRRSRWCVLFYIAAAMNTMLTEPWFVSTELTNFRRVSQVLPFSSRLVSRRSYGMLITTPRGTIVTGGSEFCFLARRCSHLVGSVHPFVRCIYLNALLKVKLASSFALRLPQIHELYYGEKACTETSLRPRWIRPRREHQGKQLLFIC